MNEKINLVKLLARIKSDQEHGDTRKVAASINCSTIVYYTLTHKKDWDYCTAKERVFALEYIKMLNARTEERKLLSINHIYFSDCRRHIAAKF